MGFGCLPWVNWAHAERWLPPTVHNGPFGKSAIQYYFEDWENACTDNRRPLLPSHLHHFLLAAGLILRDINNAHFSLADPDDADPLPEHVLYTELGLDFAVRIEGVIAKVQPIFALVPPSGSPSSAKRRRRRRRSSVSAVSKAVDKGKGVQRGVGKEKGARKEKNKEKRISTGSMDVHVDFDSFWRSARALLGGGTSTTRGRSSST